MLADAMSRYAYPASKAVQDCIWHGKLEDKLEMDDIIKLELEEERMIGMILPWKNANQKQVLLVMGYLQPYRVVLRHFLWRESEESHCCPVRSEKCVLQPFNFQSQEEHQLDPKIKAELLERASIPKCSMDFFASASNTQEDKYLGEKRKCVHI